MSASVLYKAAWLFLHLIFTLVETVLFYRTLILRKVKHFSRQSQETIGQNPAEYIKFHREYLEKIPQHLAVILGLEDPNFETLANLINWAMACEINYISIYDHIEMLQSRQEEFRDYVQAHQTIPGHVAFMSSPEGSDGNGFKRQIKVQLLSRADGKQAMGSLCRTLSQEVQRGELQVDQIDVDFVNRRLSEMSGRVPDPDVAVYTGSFCCTYGFLPWQSRLTEFIPIGSQEGFQLQDFLSVLYQYARKEQRFGK